MSNQPRVLPSTVEPFEDRIDFLYRELELSIKWQRPSILFAVYSSEYVHSAAEAVLEYKLVRLDQKVLRVSIDNKENADVIGKLAELSSVQNAFSLSMAFDGDPSMALTCVRTCTIKGNFLLKNNYAWSSG